MNRGHVLLMILCCLVPIGAFAAISLLQIPTSTVVLAALVLFCPISHFLMMGSMDHNHDPQVHGRSMASGAGPTDNEA